MTARTAFETQANRFLLAVQSRDWVAFQRFFNQELAFKAVLPGGRVFDDVNSFLESQAAWFTGTTGSFDYTLDRLESADGLGVAVAKVLYRNVGPDGKDFALNLFITLVFKHVEGRWFLVCDQNTVV